MRKDGDMRALIEHWLEKREAEYGAGLIGTFDWYDATNTWYLDYPPILPKWIVRRSLIAIPPMPSRFLPNR